MNNIKIHLNVLLELLKIRIKRTMLFQFGFWGPFFVDGSMFIIQLLVFNVIYSNITKIGEWEIGEMLIYIGTFSAINAINMLIFFFGLNSIPWKIRSGEMDLYLSKPIDPLFRFTFEQINIGSIPLIILSILIIISGIKRAGINVDFLLFARYMGCVALMTILYYDMELIVRAVSLYKISLSKLQIVEEVGLDLCMQIPGIAFRGWSKIIFYYIIPYGIMATVPVQVIVGNLSVYSFLKYLIVVVAFTCITIMIWKNGIKYYDSVNS